ncbi:MAG: UDP-N-acetylmuramoyl-L-alanyl-D-glutamate--2,6-diaminopimelate ligase [Kiritimatiellae bacterium]|nr:UDP-N-acetylmuramoyl-L-alanyl-D-glutamate--2,6-diaminopimelate ligase [Kiritimatiellia bacterium]
MFLSSCPRVLPLLLSPYPDFEFTHVRSDSRLVRPGDLFAVVQGTEQDGSRFIPNAIQAGASGLLVDASVKDAVPLADLTLPIAYTKDVRGAMGILASCAEGDPSQHMDVYAITGTNGKTTTARLLAEMLKAGGHHPGLQTTVAVEYGRRSYSSERTTPGICEMQELLGEMCRAGCDSVVMEASSHALDQRRLSSIRLAGGAFTNLTEDHLDYHRSMDAYFDAKKKLFAQLATDRPSAPAVCFVDAPGGQEMAAYCRTLGLTVRCAGITENGRTPDEPLFVRAENVKIAPDATRFTLIVEDGRRAEIHSALAGRYNIANQLCAAALALSARVPFETVVHVMNTVLPCWGRLERVDTALPCTVFVDYAHTDDALRNVLTTIREMASGKIVVVFGCGGDRDRAKRPLMGRACAECADRLVVTSDNPRSEEPMAIIREILTGIPDGKDVVVEADRREAIRSALESAGKDDIVLVAGKGHETEQIVAGAHHPFDDRQVVRELAKEIARRNTNG